MQHSLHTHGPLHTQPHCQLYTSDTHVLSPTHRLRAHSRHHTPRTIHPGHTRTHGSRLTAYAPGSLALSVRYTHTHPLHTLPPGASEHKQFHKYLRTQVRGPSPAPMVPRWGHVLHHRPAHLQPTPEEKPVPGVQSPRAAPPPPRAHVGSRCHPGALAAPTRRPRRGTRRPGGLERPPLAAQPSFCRRCRAAPRSQPPAPSPPPPRVPAPAPARGGRRERGAGPAGAGCASSFSRPGSAGSAAPGPRGPRDRPLRTPGQGRAGRGDAGPDAWRAGARGSEGPPRSGLVSGRLSGLAPRRPWVTLGKRANVSELPLPLLKDRQGAN